MAQINIKFAELHDVIFLGGTNLQQKLDPLKRTGLRLVYDREEKELLVTWNGETGIVPWTNIKCMIEGEVPIRNAILHPIAAAVIANKITAQVDSPQSHVFAGEGHGKTGKSK